MFPLVRKFHFKSPLVIVSFLNPFDNNKKKIKTDMRRVYPFFDAFITDQTYSQVE